MKIFVKQITGKSFHLDVDILDNVMEIKKQIEDKFAIPACVQRLIFKRKYLENDKPISHYNIEGDSTIYLLKHAIQIFVKDEDSTLTISIENSSMISHIKTQIEQKTGIKPAFQSLYFVGKLLLDEFALKEYSIQEESTLYLKKYLKAKSEENGEQK